ncbi:coiled-coil domain-containing protein 166 isoform X2 [Pristis pectinata]|uniref:coiled-coil domain-containing protein 166 isoform X2 n=1 Tax=Pristis pectinata TaxID=685728 RepID=UPI00223E8212|nr:coiled-coil domain-containing protein 166 isoform X2 [Pristis pectinata]
MNKIVCKYENCSLPRNSLSLGTSDGQEYIQQMAKRSEKTQNQIISLSDQNQRKLDEIRKAKEKILADFESQKQELKMTQIEKETELVQINKEVKSLSEYKELRVVQLARIQELDKQVMDARALHSQNLHNLKVKFNKEKTEYKQNAKKMVKLLEKEANKEAVCCLIQHIEAIKNENQELRDVLVCLIRRSRVLREQQAELEEQQSQLLREREYCTKLRVLRYRKQLSEYTQPQIEEVRSDEQPKTREQAETLVQPASESEERPKKPVDKGAGDGMEEEEAQDK